MDKEFAPRLSVQRHGAGTEHPATSLVQVMGDLDAANAQILRDALVAAIDGSDQAIVVDMVEVNYIDSVGLGTLVSGLKRANERGVKLRFVVTNPQITKVLNITGLVRLLDLYETREGAIAAS
jgi:anti-anti-sigma factor